MLMVYCPGQGRKLGYASEEEQFGNLTPLRQMVKINLTRKLSLQKEPLTWSREAPQSKGVGSREQEHLGYP